jgi:uncharacterized membrane protein YobD (UPF0266 family)
MINSNLFLDVAKMFALNFVEWLCKNSWIKQFNGLYFSPLYFEYKKIEELYEMFLEEEKNKLNQNQNGSK